MQNAVVGMKYFFYAVPAVKADIKYCIYKKNIIFTDLQIERGRIRSTLPLGMKLLLQ